MKTYFTKALVSLVLLLTVTGISNAQYIEDGLRLGAPGLGVGARSLGLGTASITTSTDYSAMYWNPAGLGLMQTNEFSIGLSSLSYNNTASYFNTDTKATNSATTLNNAGFVYNVPTRRGSLVFALGYGRQNEFASGLNFQGFNPNSSIIQSWAPDGVSYYNYDLSTNLAYQLWLADVDTIAGRFISPIGDSLTQSGKIIEGGGLNYWSLAGSVEAARNVYLGLTLNFLAGSYTYNRKYYEDDLGNIYASTRYPYDVNSLSLSEDLNTDISGFTMKFGFLYNPKENFRFGMTVKTPSWVTIRESFSTVATSSFKNGDDFIFPSGDIGPSSNEYSVHTPWVFGGGLSFDIFFLTLAADVDYTDWTQLQFETGYYYSSTFENYLNDLNQQVKDVMKPVLNARAGVEIKIRALDLALRGGAAYFPSPYQFDSGVNAQKYITGGLGFLFEGAIALDFGYAYGFWETSHVLYSGFDRTDTYFSTSTSEKVETHNFIVNFAYRF